MGNFMENLTLPVGLLALCAILLMLPMDDEKHPLSIVFSALTLFFALALPFIGVPPKFVCSAEMLCLLSYQTIRIYSRFRREFPFSSKKGRNLRVRCEARTFYIFLCLMLGGAYVSFGDLVPEWLPHIPVAMLLMLLAARVVTRRPLFISVRVKKGDAALMEIVGMRDCTLRKIFDDTVAYLEEKKPYANGALPLSALAREMGVNVKDLSRAVGLYSRDNYPLFIKKYRVEYATNLMIRDPYLKVTEVGRMSGFQSESSFTESFKEIVGVTPSEYLRHERYRRKRS